jgi:hypothetical protein
MIGVKTVRELPPSYLANGLFVLADDAHR